MNKTKITMTLMTRETGKSIKRPLQNNAEMVKTDVYTEHTGTDRDTPQREAVRQKQLP